MVSRLKIVLRERHLQTHSAFCREYEKIATMIDPALVGSAPKRAQFHRWLSGELKGLPYPHHCRVLEEMLPGHTAIELFAPDIGTPPIDEFATSTTPPGTPPATGPHRSNSYPGDGELAAFFGSEMADVGATLVVPTFELAMSSLDALASAGIPRQHIFSKQASVFNAAHRIDVPVALAENDVRGMLYVMSMLQHHDGIAVDIQSDRDVVAACDRPYISFGLSSNDCTHMYLEATGDPLFAIQDNSSAVGGFLEHLELADGKRYSSDDSRNIGIIARVRPAPLPHPGRYWFFCAGLGPHGTAGASWYLAKNWAVLQEQAADREFAAVVSVRRYSDQTAALEHLLTR